MIRRRARRFLSHGSPRIGPWAAAAWLGGVVAAWGQTPSELTIIPAALTLRGEGATHGLLVGEVQGVNPHLLAKLQNEQFIPVIAPIGADRAGHTFNINADLVAGAIAGALEAEKLLVLTDVKGIRDAKGRHVSTLSRKDMQRMVKKGTISAGMLPKVHACLMALDGGVQKAHIIDGRMPHAILLEVFTDKGIGTEIVS